MRTLIEMIETKGMDYIKENKFSLQNHMQMLSDW